MSIQNLKHMQNIPDRYSASTIYPIYGIYTHYIYSHERSLRISPSVPAVSADWRRVPSPTVGQTYNRHQELVTATQIHIIGSHMIVT